MFQEQAEGGGGRSPKIEEIDMWPFKKSEPTVRPVYSTELVRDTTHTILGSGDLHRIQVGLMTSDRTPGRYRVFYMQDSIIGGPVQIFPKQNSMSRDRALMVAIGWADALEVTWRMSMNQKAEDDRPD